VSLITAKSSASHLCIDGAAFSLRSQILDLRSETRNLKPARPDVQPQTSLELCYYHWVTNSLVAGPWVVHRFEYFQFPLPQRLTLSIE